MLQIDINIPQGDQLVSSAIFTLSAQAGSPAKGT
jgi:hypothetical protein